MLTSARKRGRVAALEVPSVELPESISCFYCPKIEQGLAISLVLAQRSCCSAAADSAIEKKIGRRLHFEIFYIRLRRCN